LKLLNFFGLNISSFSKEEIIFSLQKASKNSESKIYYGYSLAVLSYLKKIPEYYKITSQFDIMVTDGRLFYLLAKFFGINLKYDISIPRLTLLSLDIANKEKYNVILVGANKESNKNAQNNIIKKYPDMNSCVGIDGYFNFEKRNEIYTEILNAKPNLLLIGLPTPQKQIFALEIKNKLKDCAIIPCGGMIDVLAGKEKLTPIWIKKLGLASIYRHIQHPKRIPELIHIYFLSVKVFIICFYLKYIKKSKNINIPSIILKK